MKYLQIRIVFMMLHVAMALFTFCLFGQTYYNPRLRIPFPSEDKWGYCDTLGNILLQSTFDSIGFFELWNESHAFFKDEDRFGIIDTNYKVAVQNKYLHLRGTNLCPNGTPKLFSVGDGVHLGVMTPEGMEVLSVLYDDVLYDYLDRGHIAAKQGGRYALFDTEGRRQTDFLFEHFIPGGYCGGKKSDLCGYDGMNYLLVKPRGEVLTEPCLVLENPLHRLGNRPKSVLLSEDIKEVLSIILKLSGDKNDSIIVDFDRPLGRQIEPPFYKYLPVRKNKQIGLMTVSLYPKIEFSDVEEFHYILLMSNDVSRVYGFNEMRFVKKDDLYGIVTEMDSTLYSFKYDGFEDITYDYTVTKQNGHLGAIVFLSSYAPIPCVYDEISFERAIRVSDEWLFSVLKVSRNGRTFFVGENGVEYKQ